MKKTLLIPLMVLMLLGCSTRQSEVKMNLTQLLESAPKAGEELEEIIGNHRVVFLSEQHAVVNPIIFLSENLRGIYDSGVRYLFIEGALPRTPSSENYDFLSLFPWTQAGWKYEKVMLAIALEDLNTSLPEERKMKVIRAEAGMPSYSRYDPMKAEERLSARDVYAFGTIRGVMDKAPEGEKALVFYGGTHGKNRILKDYTPNKDVPPFDYKPLGVFLREHYGDEFLSINFEYASDYGDDAAGAGLEASGKLIYARQIKKGEIQRKLDDYDASVFERERVYGSFYQYNPTETNLRHMRKRLEYLESNFDSIIDRDSNLRYGPLGQYLMDIYYLKLYYGPSFSYSLWDPEADLETALKELEPDLIPSLSCPSAEGIREYHRLFRESRIEHIALYGERDPYWIAHAIRFLSRAGEIFPGDLWADYWMGYLHMEEGEYGKALEHWDRILEAPLSSCIENLPRICERAQYCAENLGWDARADQYASIRADLSNSHGLEYLDFGDL